MARGRIRFFREERELLSTECFRNLNLLAHAQMEELDIGSSCGGHGICGGDRVRPRCPASSLSSVTDEEREHLSASEIAEGWRLGCQAYPERDGLELDVELP